MIRVELKEAMEKIKKEPAVKEWINPLTEKSKKGYLTALGEFTLVIGKPPKELLEIVRQEQIDRLPAWEQSNRDWFKAYDDHCVKNNRSKATRDNRVGIIKSFFHFYELPTPNSTNRRTKSSKLRIKNKRPALTKDDIKKALDACMNLRLKAIILTQISSGLALADIVQLKIKDFQDGLTPITENGKEICRLNLHREKNDNEFTTFLNYEAVDAIKNYIENERKFEDEFLFQKYFRTNEELKTQIEDHLILSEYRALNKRLDNEQKEKGAYRPITTHMMRKFFNTQLTNSGMSYEPRKHMMGHAIPGVDNSYYLENPDVLEELYIKYMGEITINPTKTLTIESEEYQELKKQLNENKESSEIKDTKIYNLENRMEEMEKKNKERDAMLEELLTNPVVLKELSKKN